jgi:hypothetical protein
VGSRQRVFHRLEVNMKVAIVAVQLLIALAIVASVMPFVLVRLPVARQAGVGLAILGGAAVGCFLAVRFFWPAKRQ